MVSSPPIAQTIRRMLQRQATPAALQVSYKQRRKMRSTRASAAVARLNERSSGHHYTMALTGDGLFKLRERLAEGDKEVSAALPLDDFVRFVNTMGPQETRRITKNDAAFARQLVKKPAA